MKDYYYNLQSFFRGISFPFLAIIFLLGLSSGTHAQDFYVDDAVKDLKIPDHSFDPATFYLFAHGKPSHWLLDGEWKPIKEIKS